MKRYVFVLVWLIAAGVLWAQTDWRGEWKHLNLSDAEISQLVALVKASQPEIERDRAERAVIHAQVTRLLLDAAPAMFDIEALVRQGADWDVKIRLLRIQRSLQVRQIVGNERWADLSALAAKVSDAERAGKHPMVPKADDPPDTKEMFLLLEDFN